MMTRSRTVQRAGFFAMVMLLLSVLKASGQECLCPTQTECSPCIGGITSLTLLYNGSVPRLITINDDLGELFSGALNPGQTFTFSSINPNESFSGPFLEVYASLVLQTQINVLCNSIAIGQSFGDFTIRAATSKSGGPLCCPSNLLDTTPPLISNCPGDFQVSLPQNACTRVVNWVTPTVSDNCEAPILTVSKAPGTAFALGSTPVIYTATDKYGNQSTCSFRVNVVDNSPPVFNACPSNIGLEAINGCNRAVTWTAPVAQDNCSVTVAASHTPGSTFPVGVTTVSYIATDQSGNQATCSFTVTIRDNTNPVFSNCPTNIELTANTSCTAVATWTPPSAQDNCSVNVTTSHQPGTSFPIGETMVTYTATDPSGNTAICSFRVTVNNTQLPVLENCPDNLVMDADESNTALVTWDEPEFSIACGELIITRSHEPGDAFPVGATQVVYTAENEAGNEVECRFTVTVNRKVLNLKATPAITPNGDGIQDVWIIQDIEFFPNSRVVVVDRWGSIVYEASGYNNVSVVWTGTNLSGNVLPTGTYFYRIEIQQTREVLTGSIELVR